MAGTCAACRGQGRRFRGQPTGLHCRRDCRPSPDSQAVRRSVDLRSLREAPQVHGQDVLEHSRRLRAPDHLGPVAAGREAEKGTASLPRATSPSGTATARTSTGSGVTTRCSTVWRPSGFPSSGRSTRTGGEPIPWPGWLPKDSLNVPTYYNIGTSPATATGQLDFVFASKGMAGSVKATALNGPEEWGPSDHCRIEIEVS